MRDTEIVLVDRRSRNQLGEFQTLDQALEALRRYVAAAPSALRHLEIRDGDTQVRIDPETLRAAPGGVVATAHAGAKWAL